MSDFEILVKTINELTLLMQISKSKRRFNELYRERNKYLNELYKLKK